MNAGSDQIKRRLLAAVFALVALLALVTVLARTRPPAPAAQSAPAFAVVKIPGGGHRIVQLQPAHATTQSSPGGQTHVVSATGLNGSPVTLSQPAGGGDR